MSILRKLVRGYEAGAEDYEEYFKKAKAFGISTKFFSSDFCQNAINFLSRKSYKDHKSRNTNDDLHRKYYEFELARKKHINNCYQLSHSDARVVRDLCFYINMPNPFKCATRGRFLPDIESINEYSGIDEKGEDFYV